MSNRDTDVYDNIIIDSSTSNKDICNNLNLPYTPGTQNPGGCVKETKYYIKDSDTIKPHSSNLVCSDNNDSNDANKKLVTIKNSFRRPWTRFNTTCFYRNGQLTQNAITNNIKKLNVRRKAEILQYLNGNRLTKAQKYSLLSKGINKFNKKQYAFQTMNRVPAASATTDPNPYNLNAFGPFGVESETASDWLSGQTVFSRLQREQANPVGITLLKCKSSRPFEPTPLSASDVPRVSKKKLDNPATNPFPVLSDINNPDTAAEGLDSYNNPINNTLYLNKNDNLVNHTPVTRTYKGGSEKWPETTWEEGDEGFPNFKSGSDNTIYSDDVINTFNAYYDNNGNLLYTDTSVDGFYLLDSDNSFTWTVYNDWGYTNPLISNPNYITDNNYESFETSTPPSISSSLSDKKIEMVLSRPNVSYYIFDDVTPGRTFSNQVPSLCNIEKFVEYIIIYPNRVIPINSTSKKNFSMIILSPNGREIKNDTNFNDSGEVDTYCEYKQSTPTSTYDQKDTSGNSIVTKPTWPHYIIHQWSNMKLSNNPHDWSVNDSNVNLRPEIGNYKIIYEYTDGDIYTYATITLTATAYPLQNALQLNPWDWYSSKGTTNIPPPAPPICYQKSSNQNVCPCLSYNNEYDPSTDKTCVTDDCNIEKYGNNITNPLIIPAGRDETGNDQPWFDPWIRIKWTHLSYYYEQEYYINIRHVDKIIRDCSDINSGVQVWPINNRDKPILFPAPSLPVDALLHDANDDSVDPNGDNYYDFENTDPDSMPGPYNDNDGILSDQANRENYSTLWDCILYPVQNPYSPLCEYINNNITGSTDIINELTPKNYTDRSNVFAKITINEFNILSINYYTVNQAKSIVDLTSQSIINNTRYAPQSLNINDNHDHGGRPQYYMYSKDSQVLFKDSSWSTDSYKITQIYLSFTINSSHKKLTLKSNEIKSTILCSSTNSGGECESRCCYNYYEFEDEDDQNDIYELTNLGSIKAGEKYYVMNDSSQGFPFLNSITKKDTYDENDALSGDDFNTMISNINGLIKCNNALKPKDSPTVAMIDECFEIMQDLGAPKKYYVLNNANTGFPFLISDTQGGVPLTGEAFNVAAQEIINNKPDDYAISDNAALYYKDVAKNDVLSNNDPSIYAVVFKKDNNNNAITDVYYSTEAYNNVVCLDEIEKCLPDINQGSYNSVNFEFTYDLINISDDTDIPTNKSDIKYPSNPNKLVFTIQKDPLYPYSLQSLTIEDTVITIDKSCNTNYYTQETDEASSINWTDINGYSTNTLYFNATPPPKPSDSIYIPLSGNWYKIENFICEPSTEDSDCLQISFEFYITIDLSYDRQLFTINDFLQSLNFNFNVTYSDSVNTSQILTVPANIINFPDNTTEETIYRPLPTYDNELLCDSTSYSEYKSISLTTCEKNSSVVCSDKNVYSSNKTSYHVYRCTDQNIILTTNNSSFNQLYCCPWYNGNSSYNGKYIGNICKPKIEEQKRWFTFFYMNYEDNVPKTEITVNLEFGESVTFKNSIVYSSYLTSASYTNFLEYNVDKSVDDINNIEDIKSKLVYPIYSSTVAKNSGLIYRKYFVTEPILKTPDTYGVGVVNWTYEGASANPVWIDKTLSINGSNGKKITLNYNNNNISLIPRKCYSTIRYMVPVDTVRPKLSSSPDLYGSITKEQCDVDVVENGVTVQKQFNKKTCSFTSNIVIIKSSLANKASDKKVTIHHDDGTSQEVLMATQVFTVFEIQDLYCADRTNQTTIYEACKDPSYQEPDPSNPTYGASYCCPSDTSADNHDGNCAYTPTEFGNAQTWLQEISNFYEWMQNKTVQTKTINGVDTYDPYKFYLRFYSTKKLNNSENQVVYNVAQSRIIQMIAADEEISLISQDQNPVKNITDFLKVSSSIDILQEYRPDRNTSGQITNYLLSDYFDFGTLVYPDEFIALQNSQTQVVCNPRFEKDQTDPSLAPQGPSQCIKCDEANDCTQGETTLFEWRILLKIKKICTTTITTTTTAADGTTTTTTTTAADGTTTLPSTHTDADGTTTTITTTTASVPVTLPGGYIQIRTWFGNVQDNYGNLFMGQQKLLNDSTVNNNNNNMLELLTTKDNSVPFNFPNISFSEWPLFTDTTNSDDNRTLPQIYNISREITGLCGFFPNFTRRYIYDYFITYYCELTGIGNINNYDRLILLLNQYLNSSIGWVYDKSKYITVNSNVITYCTNNSTNPLCNTNTLTDTTFNTISSNQNINISLDTWYKDFITSYKNLESTIPQSLLNDFPSESTNFNYNLQTSLSYDITSLNLINNLNNNTSTNILDFNTLADILVSINNNSLWSQNKNTLYQVYNNIDLQITTAPNISATTAEDDDNDNEEDTNLGPSSRLIYKWPGDSVEYEVNIGGDVYDINQINIIFQNQMRENNHYLIDENNKPVYFAEIKVVTPPIAYLNQGNKIQIITKEIPTETQLGTSGNAYFQYRRHQDISLPTDSNDKFINVILPAKNDANYPSDLFVLLGFHQTFSTEGNSNNTIVVNDELDIYTDVNYWNQWEPYNDRYNYSNDDDPIPQPESSTTVGYSMKISTSFRTELIDGKDVFRKQTINTNMTLTRLKNNLWKLLLIEESLTQLGFYNITNTSKLLDSEDRSNYILLLLKTVTIKLNLIYTISNIAFKGFFGENLDYFTDLDGSLGEENCKSIPIKCDTYPSTNIDSQWSSILNLDIVTDNIAESNILNFSCFYENISISYVTATCNIPKVANVINNKTLIGLKPIQNQTLPSVTLKITIITNNPIDITESNNFIDEFKIKLLKLPEGNDCYIIPNPITDSDLEDITSIFNFEGVQDSTFESIVKPTWIRGGSLNQYFVEIPLWNSDHQFEVYGGEDEFGEPIINTTTVGDLLKNKTSYYLYLTMNIRDECCNNAKSSTLVVPFLTNSIQVNDTTTPYISQITTDTNNNPFNLTSNGNIVSFGSIKTYIFNNTNEYVIFQMTVNTGHLCFLYNEDNTEDIQNPDELIKKYKIYWKKKTDLDWLSENILTYPSASKIFDITDNVLSFLIQKNELLQSLSAGVTANEIIDYTEYDFKIEFEDITGNEYDTFDSTNNEKNGCLVIDNKPVEITSGTFYAEPAQPPACQDDVPEWKKYAMVGDTITLTINTNGKINTILNNSNYETNFTNGTNILQGDTLTYPDLNSETNKCVPPYKNDNSNNSTYIISYILASTSSDTFTNGDKIQFNISYKDCSGNEKSYTFAEANNEDSNFSQITVDTTKPVYSSSVVSDNCYSSSKVKSGDILTLTISPDELIRTNLATNCKLGVDFYYRIPPLNGEVYLNQDLDTDAQGNNQGLITYNTPQTDPPTKALNTNIEAYLTIPQLPTGTLVGPATSEAGKIYYTVTIFDLAGNQGDSSELDSGLTIDNDPPTISSFTCKDAQSSNLFPNTTTNSVTTYYVKGNKKIQFDLTSDENLVNSNSIPSPTPEACNSTTLNLAVEVTEFKINTADVSLQNPFTLGSTLPAATNWISTWTVPTTGDGDLTMKLNLTDEAGNESGDIDPFNNVEKCNFVIDNTKPTFNSYTVTTDGNAHYESDGTTVDTYYAIMGKTITFDFDASEYISEPTVKFIFNASVDSNGDYVTDASGNIVADATYSSEYCDNTPPFSNTNPPGGLCTDIQDNAGSNNSQDVANPADPDNNTTYYKKRKATFTIPNDWNSDYDGVLTIQISGFYDIAGNLGDTVSFTTGDSGTGDLATAIIDIDTVKPQLTSFTLHSNGNTITNSNTPPDVTQYYAKVGNIITFTFNTSEKVKKPTIKLSTTNPDSNKFDFDSSNISGADGDCETVYGAETNGTVPLIKYCDKWTATFTIPDTEANNGTWNSEDDDGNIIIEVSNYEDEHGNIGNPLTFSETSTNNSTKITVPITIDTIPPTLSPVSITSSNTTNTLATVGDTITLSFTVSETLLNDPTVQILSNSATKDTTVAAPSYKYTYTVVSGDTQGTATFSISATDLAGNVTSGVNAITTGNNVIVDTTPPTGQAPPPVPSTTGDLANTITSATYTINGTNYTWDINPTNTANYLNIVQNEQKQTLSFQWNDNHLFSTSTLLEVWFENTANNNKYPEGTPTDPFFNTIITTETEESLISGNVILTREDHDNDSNTPKTILPDTSNYNGQNFQLHARVSDKAGNVKKITSGVFQANFTAPKVTKFEVSNNLIIGSTATVTLEFDVDVFNFNSNFDITPVPNATLTKMTPFNGDKKKWTGTLEPANNKEDSSNVLTLVANSYSDKANNLGPGATSNNYEVDTIRPETDNNTVLTSNNTYNSSYAIAGKTLSFVVEFTEPVEWTTASNATFSFNIGATQKTAVAISKNTDSDNKVTFQYTVASGDTGVVALPSSPVITMLGGDSIKDILVAPGNTMTNLALQSLSGSVTVDTTLPTISSTTDFTNQNLCTVTFSEEVLDDSGAALTIANFSVGIVTNYTSNPTNYTPTFTVAAQSPFTSDNKTFNFIITITNGSYIIGSEEIVFTPQDVYDQAGNEASEDQTNNRSALTNITTSATASSVTIVSNNNF